MLRLCKAIECRRSLLGRCTNFGILRISREVRLLRPCPWHRIASLLILLLSSS
uniref:Putative disease resistance protein RGA4 n=1 Tax=Rhizophora mucronata TaxID=61149 RepID=A0A2P2MWV2_RHIMU